MKQLARVTVRPDGKEVWVQTGSTLKDALFAALIPLSMPCGGHGRCGRCVVMASGRLSPMGREERTALGRRRGRARLACLARVEGHVTITVPAESRLTVQSIRSRGVRRKTYRLRPAALKVLLDQSRASQWIRLGRRYRIAPTAAAAALLYAAVMENSRRGGSAQPAATRRRSTAVIAGGDIVDLEPGDTTSRCYGAAVDVGTNTVVSTLVDLVAGREVATAAAVNPQMVHGDDVISRIRYSGAAGGLETLRGEIVGLINGLLREVTLRMGIDPGQVYAVSVVGNTVMQHILLGVSPAELGRAPYRVPLLTPVETLAANVGIDANRSCLLLVAPVIGGFVGGDLVGLMVSQGLHKRRRPVLAVDLGTNGEMVVAGGGILAACSTAAGPAFEGERISSGVRAVEGAIEDVRIAGGRVSLRTIGRGRPLGICGSGVIALVGELVRAGVLEPSGRIRTRREIRSRALAARVVEGDRGREFLVSLRPRVALRQGDVREVQLGKAAVAAGARALLGETGLRPAEIAEVLIAGGFGSGLRAASIRAIGLLPAELTTRVRVVGNSAIEGAKLFLQSRQAWEVARDLAARTRHVELFSKPEFKDQFCADMSFPSR